MDILESRLEMHRRGEAEAFRGLREAIEAGPAEVVLAALLASRVASARREECEEVRAIVAVRKARDAWDREALLAGEEE